MFHEGEGEKVEGERARLRAGVSVAVRLQLRNGWDLGDGKGLLGHRVAVSPIRPFPLPLAVTPRSYGSVSAARRRSLRYRGRRR
jgi:hypothetical protein